MFSQACPDKYGDLADSHFGTTKRKKNAPDKTITKKKLFSVKMFLTILKNVFPPDYSQVCI